uniref:Putative ppargamma constitutive coactivator 1 n=1 Tax=Tabanus bromius TaxID=304241 RepID=A0A0K8TMG5_TABBR
MSGGRHILLQEHAEKFFQKLVNAGAKLVFFVDGPLKEAKLRVWTISMTEIYNRQFKSTVPDMSVGRLMTIYYSSFPVIVRKFGKVYISLKNECDADIAIFASKMNAFAVLTNDTDFLIFPGDWRIWSTDEFDMDTFETAEWNKAYLRKNLKLEQKFMPIFATMCGTDYMPKECVEHIRTSLGKGFFHPELARLVRGICPNGTPMPAEERKSLLALIQKDHKTSFSESEIEKSFDDSMNFYCCPDRPTGGIKEAWLRQHILQTHSTIVYIIMNNVPIPLPQYLIHAEHPNAKQFCELTLPLFQRQMGVVLRDKDSSHKHDVSYKANHDEPFKRTFVELIKPTIEVPPIEDILLSKEMKIETKLDILSDILLPGNEEFRRKLSLLDMKQATFVPILKIYYLKENNQISIDEADVLLLSIHESINMDSVARRNVISPKIFDYSAVWIGMVYNQIHTVFTNCLIVSGLHEFIQPEVYDGFIFHKMYEKFLVKSPEEKSVLIEPIKELRIYAN